MATDQQRGLRLTPGELLAGIGGLVLFVSLFIDWYGVDVDIDADEVGGEELAEAFGLFLDLAGFNAWESFAFIDVLLALIAVAAIVFAAMRIMDSLPPLPIAPGLVLAGLGVLALVLVLFRLVATPNPELTLGDETFNVKDDDGDVSRELWGPLFALLGSLALAFGGFRASLERPGVAPRPAAAAGAPGAYAGGPVAGGGPVAPGGPLSGPPPGAGPAPGGAPVGGTPTQAAPSPQPAQQAGGPKADWYPDPHGQARLRYWDGSSWTDQTAD